MISSFKIIKKKSSFTIITTPSSYKNLQYFSSKLLLKNLNRPINKTIK